MSEEIDTNNSSTSASKTENVTKNYPTQHRNANQNSTDIKHPLNPSVSSQVQKYSDKDSFNSTTSAVNSKVGQNRTATSIHMLSNSNDTDVNSKNDNFMLLAFPITPTALGNSPGDEKTHLIVSNNTIGSEKYLPKSISDEKAYRLGGSPLNSSINSGKSENVLKKLIINTQLKNKSRVQKEVGNNSYSANDSENIPMNDNKTENHYKNHSAVRIAEKNGNSFGAKENQEKEETNQSEQRETNNEEHIGKIKKIAPEITYYTNEPVDSIDLDETEGHHKTFTQSQGNAPVGNTDIDALLADAVDEESSSSEAKGSIISDQSEFKTISERSTNVSRSHTELNTIKDLRQDSAKAIEEHEKKSRDKPREAENSDSTDQRGFLRNWLAKVNET